MLCDKGCGDRLWVSAWSTPTSCLQRTKHSTDGCSSQWQQQGSPHHSVFVIPCSNDVVTCFEIILNLFQCFISHVTTSETEMKLFQPPMRISKVISELYFSDIEYVGKYSRAAISLWNNNFEIILYHMQQQSVYNTRKFCVCTEDVYNQSAKVQSSLYILRANGARWQPTNDNSCLLYTSDAADE